MKKCCICRNVITTEEPTILFIGQNGDEKEICPECEKQINIVMESENPKDIKSAINYLYTCENDASDEEVASFLKEAIESNSSVVGEQEEKQAKNNPVNISQKRDYFVEKQYVEETENIGSLWISGMKILAWISFFSFIIGGIVLAAVLLLEETGGGFVFLVILISMIGAFLSVAGIMIFLNMASDISEIKYILKIYLKKQKRK